MRIPGRRVPTDTEDRLMHRRLLQEGLERLRGAAFDIVHVHTPFLAHEAGTRFARRIGVPCAGGWVRRGGGSPPSGRQSGSPPSRPGFTRNWPGADRES